MNTAIRHSVVGWPVADVSARLTTHDAVVCTTSLLASDAELSRALTLLSADERRRHATFTNAVVARRFAIGRSVLREIVGCALGAAPQCIPLVEGVHGKPALARGATARPLWFSVAHCEDLQIVALSRTSDVGVDVERARSIEQWERVADRVLDASERAQLRSAVDAGEEPGMAFLRSWCRVEAELKAIGSGIAGLEEHRAGRRPLGLRLLDLNDLPLPSVVMASGARYQAALALCAPGVEGARQSAMADTRIATSHPTTPITTPAAASTA